MIYPISTLCRGSDPPIYSKGKAFYLDENMGYSITHGYRFKLLFQVVTKPKIKKEVAGIC